MCGRGSRIRSHCGLLCLLLHLHLLGDGGGHWLVRMEWRPAVWSVCLPLLIFSCTIKSRSSLLAPADPGGPRKRAVKLIVCMCYTHWNLSAAHPYCSARLDTYAAVCVWQNAAISGEVGVATVRRSRVSRVHEEVDISRLRLGPQLHVKHAVHSADDDRHGADTGRHPVQLSPPLCPHRSGRSVLSDGIQAGVAAGGSGVRAILCRRLRLIQDGSELRPDDLRATGSHSQP